MVIGNKMNVPDKYYLKGALLLDQRNPYWNKIQKICKETMNPMIVLDKESSWNYIKENTDYYLQRAIYNDDAIIETWDDLYIAGNDIKYLLLVILGRYHIHKNTFVKSNPETLRKLGKILRFYFGILIEINDNIMYSYRVYPLFFKSPMYIRFLNFIRLQLYRIGFNFKTLEILPW